MESGNADAIIYNCVDSVRISAILLQPYMPEKMKTLLDLLGVDEGRRTIKYAQLGGDFEYGVSKVPLGQGKDEPLFPRLITEA